MAHEVVTTDGADTSADIWSAEITALKLFSRVPPFIKDITPHQARDILTDLYHEIQSTDPYDYSDEEDKNDDSAGIPTPSNDDIEQHFEKTMTPELLSPSCTETPR
jgi:hypothetical protein